MHRRVARLAIQTSQRVKVIPMLLALVGASIYFRKWI